MKFKIARVPMILLLVISACNSPANTSSEQANTNPTPYPLTPTPAPINAPIIEASALVDIHFLNELEGWGVTETQIIRTNDGGLSWHNLTPSEITETGYSIRTFALDANHFWAQFPDFNNYPNSGFVYRTVDGGTTWTKSATPFSTGDIQFLDSENGWVLADLGVGAGSNAVAVYQTSDGGATWNQTYINDPNAPNAHASLPLGGLKGGLAPLNMKTAFVYGVVYAPGNVYLFRTDNGGANWGPVESVSLPKGTENFEVGVDPDHMRFVSPTDGFLAVRIAGDTMQTAVYVSNDAGNTWALTPTLIPGGGAADFLSATEAVLYNGEQFYITHDAARTWNIIPPDIVFGDMFAMMDFVNTSTGWVITLDQTNHRSLYRTTNGGSTWLPVIS